jgi:hypothetical protein
MESVLASGASTRTTTPIDPLTRFPLKEELDSGERFSAFSTIKMTSLLLGLGPVRVVEVREACLRLEENPVCLFFASIMP